VQVGKAMRTNSKNPVELACDLKGKVQKIDKDGDALIAFDGFDKKHWVKAVNFCNLHVVEVEATAEAAKETEAAFDGACVKVCIEFRSSSKNPIDLHVGLKGKVDKIDKDGDALIAFDGHDTKHWVKKRCLCNLSIVKAEKVTAAKANSNSTYISLAAEKPFVCSRCSDEKTACDRCWGSGKSCWGCSGFGFRETGTGQDCCLCDGVGKMRKKHSTWQTCSMCGGSGKDSNDCGKCAGTGGEECRRCRGRGRPKCSHCYALFKQATNPAGLGVEPSPGVTIKQCSPADIEALKKLWTERNGHGSLLAAWSVDNPLLSWRLRKRKQDFRVGNNKEADELEGFHGTPASNVLAIVQNGFDSSRRSGQVYGAGEYFAKCPEVSKSYCRGDSYMIVCRLLLGTQASNERLGDGDHIWVPSMGYYVISSPEQVAPQYILKFNAKDGPRELEKVLSLPKWTTLEQACVQTIPENRPCAMTAPFTDALWMGYLHPQHSDEQLESDIDKFLKEHLPTEHRGFQLCIVRGKYTQAKARLQAPLAQAIVQKLNHLPFIEAGVKRTITVDDSHGSPGQRCPRAVAQYCRGRNLRFVDPCWCDHSISPTASATYSLTVIELGSARGDEICSKFMSSAPFHNGQPRVVGIKAINNPILRNLHDRFRKYLADKNKEEPKVIELYHGTNNNILDTLYTHGLQPPSDMSPAEDCPISGGKSLCTSICDNSCEKCTAKHQWNKCHMFGLGIYLADIAQKSHRYTSQPSCPQGGKQRYRMVLCSVLMGHTLMIEGHLRKGECMHDVSALRRIWKGELEGMVEPLSHGRPLLPKGTVPVEEHDLIFVKGLGTCCRSGFSVHNSEYISFHPYQCLPRYEIEYEL